MGFRFEDKALKSGLDMLMVKLPLAILMHLDTKASEIQGSMKENRPWTDRTGDAKKTLSAKVVNSNGSNLRIVLSHGVDYGIWLELAHGGNYAIIQPTLKREGPKVIASLEGLMNKLL